MAFLVLLLLLLVGVNIWATRRVLRSDEFLKYVSDVWQDHYDEYKKQYGDHPELIEEMLKNERFVLPASASYYALHALRHSPGNGERIDKALHAIEDTNIAKLRDVFQDSRDFEAGKNQNYLREADLQRILTTAFTRQGSDKYAHLATPAEIAENDFNLNIPRYVDTFEEEEAIDLKAVREERLRLKAELARLEEQMAGCLKELGYE